MPGLVSLSLSKTIKTYPAIGWVRGNTVANADILSEVNTLRKQNQELEQLINQLGTQTSPSPLNDIAGLDDEVTLSGVYYGSGTYQKSTKYDWEYKIKWGELFALIAPYLLEHPNDALVKQELQKSVFKKTDKSSSSSAYIDDQIFQTVKIQLVALGLVETRYLQTTSGAMALFWLLTKFGEEQLFQYRTIKKG